MNYDHDFLVSTLKEHTQALALPKGRRVGQPGHDVAREYLLTQMERFNLEPFAGNSFELVYERPHPVSRSLQRFTNLVGVIPGKNRDLPPILLGAHYDSVIDAPCVDDNATSVAHNLALAEYYQDRPLQRDLIFAFFDAEEPPHFLGETMGSRRFVEDYCSDIDFAAAIVTDLVGHDFTDTPLPAPLNKMKGLFPQLKKLVGVIGMESNASFPALVEQAASRAKGLRVITTPHKYVGPLSDHAAFSAANQPFLFLSCGQGTHYHTPQDTMEWINFDKLAHITSFIADLVESIDSLPENAPSGSVETFDQEMRMLKNALGITGMAALKMALRTLSPPKGMPKTREEMDEIVQWF